MSSVRAKTSHRRNAMQLDTSRKSDGADSLLEHDHLCILYEDNGDLSRKCATLTRGGIAAGFRCFYVFDSVLSCNIAALLGNDAQENGTIVNAEDLMEF